MKWLIVFAAWCVAFGLIWFLLKAASEDVRVGEHEEQRKQFINRRGGW